MKESAAPLRNTPFGDDSRRQNIFETQIGLFRDDHITHRYMVARRQLVESYFHAASAVDVKEVWEKALYHALVQLREAITDPRGMIYVTPFILLNLNRDDEAYDLVRYWVSVYCVWTTRPMTEIMSRHVESKEGEFFYPRTKNGRYQDLFEEYPAAVDEQDMLMVFLVTLLIIKLRIVAAYDAACASLDLVFHETTGGRLIQEVRCTVADMIIDERLVNIDSQRRQIDQLVEIIDRRNPTTLPAILNPLPLISQRQPATDVRGEPSEAYEIVTYSYRCFARIPGARKMLEDRYGPNPTYNATMHYD